MGSGLAEKRPEDEAPERRTRTSPGDLQCSGCDELVPAECGRFCPYCGDARSGTPMVRVGGVLATAGFDCPGLPEGGAAIGERFPGRRVDGDTEIEVQAVPASHPVLGHLTKRFCEDALALETLEHPNIEPVLKVVSDGDRVLVVTDGPGAGRGGWTTAQVEEGYAFAQVVKIGRACSEALDAAHRKGVIHGGPRPEDVLMGPRGEVVLRNFGVRGLAGAFAGHPVATDVDSDLYALSVTLFELTTGRSIEDLPDLGST